jgi:hypothetical protein
MSASWTRQNRSPWIALLNLASIPSGEQSVVLNRPAAGHVAQPTRTVSARPPAIKIFGDRFAMNGAPVEKAKFAQNGLGRVDKIY